jgi:hypothetical protein
MSPNNSPLTSLREFFSKRRPHEHETALFLLVSMLDFFMTYWMLINRPAAWVQFVESNPAARYFLDSWGVKGLLSFKMAAVLVVILATVLIAERRPLTARVVLWLGVAVTSGTVLYSFLLYTRHAGLA